jgi:hypothetical protein
VQTPRTNNPESANSLDSALARTGIGLICQVDGTAFPRGVVASAQLADQAIALAIELSRVSRATQRQSC